MRRPVAWTAGAHPARALTPASPPSPVLPQLAVRSTGVKEVSIWAISNPQQNVEFERRSASLLRLDSWVDVNAMEDVNSIQEVCQRGFRVSESGLLFNVGNVNFGDSAQTQHQFLLCSVAVGKSFVLDGPEAERKLPAGYDSLYVHDPAGEGSPDGPGYAHKYVVFDGAQSLPRYVVHFTFDPVSPVSRQKVGEINLSELRSKIAQALSVLGPSASAAAERMLADVGSSYESALKKSSDADPLLEERKRSISDALKQVDEKLSSIQANSKAVEDALYARMQEAIFALQDATQKKMNALLSEELELRRQLGQIAWIEGFVTTMQETLPPMTFITAWERHAAVRAGMYAALGGRISTRALDDIQPDMAVVGSVQVVCGKAAASASAAAAQGGAAAASSSPAPSPSAAPVNLNDLLAGILKAQLGGGGSSTPTVSAGAAAVPIVTLDQARANFERARADVDAVEAMVSSLPADMKPQGEAARVQAKARLAEAEAIHTAHSARSAAAAASSASAAGGGAAAVAPAAVAPSGPTFGQARGATASTTAAVSVKETPRTAVSAPLEQRLARFSLRREAERKARQRGLELESLDASLAFAESSILHPDEAMALFMVLPWGGMGGMEETMGGMGGGGGLGALPPVCRLLFSTEKSYPPTVTTMVTNYMQAGNRDATILVVRANGYVFGGYAADAWDLSECYGGTPRSFLFSVTKDARVPFTGRVKGPRQANDDHLRMLHEESNLQAQAEFEALVSQARESSGQEPTFDEAGRLLLTQPDENGMPTLVRIPVPRPKPFVRNDATRSGPDFVQFGLKDLILAGDFSSCTSELEQSYGMGLRPEEARVILAGAPAFRAEAVELWAISPAGGMGEGGDGAAYGSYADGGYNTPMH